MSGDDSADVQRTRGGWEPVGTSAERRARSSQGISKRGRETKRHLLDSARAVFSNLGYLDATIDDIVEDAGMARGSFYTYFPSKLQIFKEVAAEVDAAIHESVTTQPGDVRRDVISNLDRSHRRYVAAYREHALIYGLTEQVATIDPVFAEARLASRQAHIDRVVHSINRWISRGLADPALDVRTVAGALVSLTSNFSYWRFVGGDEYDDEQAAEALTEIWVRALRLRAEPTDPE